MEGPKGNPDQRPKTIPPEVIAQIVAEMQESTDAAVLDRIVRDATTRPYTGAHDAPFEPRHEP